MIVSLSLSFNPLKEEQLHRQTERDVMMPSFGRECGQVGANYSAQGCPQSTDTWSHRRSLTSTDQTETNHTRPSSPSSQRLGNKEAERKAKDHRGNFKRYTIAPHPLCIFLTSNLTFHNEKKRRKIVTTQHSMLLLSIFLTYMPAPQFKVILNGPGFSTG